MSERKVYPSDLNDTEWSLLEPHIPAIKAGGRPAKYSRREIVNGILYVLRGGIAWRMMPHDLPAWDTVYAYYNRWRKAGIWERIHQVLYTQMRIEMGRQAQASLANADSQSVKITEKGG
jgi:putative transposase